MKSMLMCKFVGTFCKTPKKILLPLLAILLLFSCSPYSGWEYDCTKTDVLGGGKMNDTTALLLMKTYDWWTNGGPGGGTEERNVEEYLALVDIRFEKIYWKKPFNIDINIGFTLADSVLFFYEIDYNNYLYNINKISTIAVDEQFAQLEKIVVPNGKDLELMGEAWRFGSNIAIRPWKDGKFLASSFHRWSEVLGGGIENNYALIDTIVGTFERWTPTGEYEWMNECEDVKWSLEGGFCSKEGFYYLPSFYNKKWVK